MKKALLVVLALACLAAACAKRKEITLPTEAPLQKATPYSEALARLGRLTKLFGSERIFIQAQPVQDSTGTAQAGGAEIPFDVTEMLKSSVNKIGGSIVFVPYEPQYIQNQSALQYTTLAGKARPDVMITGAITEFDRSIDVVLDQESGEGEVGTIAAILGEVQTRRAMSRVGLDLNMVDVATLSMLPRIQAVNTINVFKAAQDDELAFSLLGATFGLKGSVKRIQGVHAAVRVLVEMSVLQVIGRRLELPYWKCVDAGAKPDPVVLENVRERFAAADDAARLRMVRKLLRLYGLADLPADGPLDRELSAALLAFEQAYGVPAETVDENLYEQLFRKVPLFGEKSRIATAPAQGLRPSGPPMPKAAELTVKLWTDKQEYREGEAVSISLFCERDFYGRILYLTASGEIVQLVPNELKPDGFFRGGKTYTIPAAGDAFNLVVAAPFGEERLVVYASESPLPELALKPLGQGLRQFAGSKDELDRAMGVGAAVREAAWTIRTLPR